MTLISPYVEKDSTAFCTYEEFEKGVEALRAFCTLRGESIAGQLDGSIPSTSEGQSAESSALIDASTISISDMGKPYFLFRSKESSKEKPLGLNE